MWFLWVENVVFKWPCLRNKEQDGAFGFHSSAVWGQLECRWAANGLTAVHSHLHRSAATLHTHTQSLLCHRHTHTHTATISSPSSSVQTFYTSDTLSLLSAHINHGCPIKSHLVISAWIWGQCSHCQAVRAPGLHPPSLLFPHLCWVNHHRWRCEECEV